MCLLAYRALLKARQAGLGKLCTLRCWFGGIVNQIDGPSDDSVLKASSCGCWFGGIVDQIEGPNDDSVLGLFQSCDDCTALMIALLCYDHRFPPFLRRPSRFSLLHGS